MLIPHSELEPIAAAFLLEVIEDARYFVCDECAARLSVKHVARSFRTWDEDQDSDRDSEFPPK